MDEKYNRTEDLSRQKSFGVMMCNTMWILLNFILQIYPNVDLRAFSCRLVTSHIKLHITTIR